MSELIQSQDGYYIENVEEDWFFRPDVAGYQFPDENYRIGISRNVIQTATDVNPLLAILDIPFDETYLINTARAVITKDMLQNPSDDLRKILNNDLEAIMSLENSGNQDLSDCYFVIFSRNHDSRQTTPEVIQKELEDARFFLN